MGVMQEMPRVGAVVPHQSEQGCPVATPVMEAQTIGFLLVEFEMLAHVSHHRPADLRKDLCAGVMQRVVEVKKPGFVRKL